MTHWLLNMFGTALLFTLLIELAVAVLYNIRSRQKLLLVVLVNILTNPPAVLLHWLGSLYLPALPDLWLQLGLELLVILAEALIYHSFSTKKESQLQHPVLLSLTANTCSWLAGFFLL